MAYSLIGKNFTPPDIRAKVTGQAKYSEDIRAEGMVFCRLLTSPLPHGRIVSIDTSAAEAMEGVLGILRASEVPNPPEPATPMLTDEPKYIGQPILAVAAVDETTAHNAIEQIRIEFEELPFTVDPLQSLYPGGPDARPDGNMVAPGVELRRVKWTAQDFAAVEAGQLPMGEATLEWSYGDVDEGFANAAVVLDETFVTQGLSHHSLEPRTAMAYWENGKCILHGSSQSQSFPHPGIAEYVGIPPEDLIFVAEYCGGGFGSKGGPYPFMAIPAHMSRKIGRPVMMRVSRHEEHFIGSARPGFQGRIRMGFAADGRFTAADLYLVQENGPTTGWSDYRAAADAISLVYSVPAMRFRGIPINTNTPPRGPQRGPGQNQIAMAVEPLLDKAAAELGVDQFQIRRINATTSDTRYGANQSTVTSAFLGEALDIGREQFDWETRLARSGQRNGSKVRGVGIGQAYHSAGSSGFDGLVRITPDGILHIHTGVGNLGTYSHTGTALVAGEVLKYNWDNCVVERGDSRKHLPWNFGQFGSNTTYTHSRTNYVAAMDALVKLKEIAAADLGGAPDDYDIGEETVFATADPSRNMTYAQAAQRAVELGGRFSGQEYPEDLNDMTKRSVEALAGTGLIGVSKDNLGRSGTVAALAAGFMEIELDLETGKWEIIDYLGVADCGTVMHPQGLSTQIRGGGVMGIGMAATERHIYDPQNGLPATSSLNQIKPPSYLDLPSEMQWAAVGEPDPENPMGMKGVGEPVQGCAAAALLCAISNALGGHYFNRTPIVPDMIVNAATGRSQSHGPLQVNTA